eukprot:3880834-Amphidinium_carterae.1
MDAWTPKLKKGSASQIPNCLTERNLLLQTLDLIVTYGCQAQIGARKLVVYGLWGSDVGVWRMVARGL